MLVFSKDQSLPETVVLFMESPKPFAEQGEVSVFQIVYVETTFVF